MQVSKCILLNSQINGQKVYKSDKYILRQKYNLNISVPYETLQYYLLPPMTPLTSQ